MAKNDFLARQRVRDRTFLDVGLQCGRQQILDMMTLVTITGAEDLKRTASRNYEAEYHELHHKYSSLYEDHQAMETEFVRMRAQLDIVYMIFGGK